MATSNACHHPYLLSIIDIGGFQSFPHSLQRESAIIYHQISHAYVLEPTHSHDEAMTYHHRMPSHRPKSSITIASHVQKSSRWNQNIVCSQALFHTYHGLLTVIIIVLTSNRRLLALTHLSLQWASISHVIVTTMMKYERSTTSIKAIATSNPEPGQLHDWICSHRSTSHSRRLYDIKITHPYS